MRSSSSMHINQQVIEITGNPAQVWANMLVPAKGRITVKITGDTLQGITKTGLEKKESWTRIQNIDSIEILESPTYGLIGIGFFLIFSGWGALNRSSFLGLILFLGGAAIIVFAFKYKRRCLAIHSHRNTLVIFMNNSSDIYQQFAMNVLAIARKLNTPVSTPPRQAQTQTQ